MAAKKTFLLVFLLVLILSINSVLGHDGESTMDQMKGAGQEVKDSASEVLNNVEDSAATWSDWFKNKMETHSEEYKEPANSPDRF